MTTLRATVARALFAIVIAFSLWVFVTYTSNPDQRSFYDNVPVEFDGLASTMLVVDDQGQPRAARPQVNIIVDADAETLQTLSTSDLRVFVDVRDLGPGEHSVAVNVVATRAGLTQIRPSVEPAYLLVRIDEIVERAVPLTVEVTGSVPFGFEAGQPTVSATGEPIAQVTVRGPQEIVRRVRGARVVADISGLAANYNSPRTLEAVDSDEQPLAGVTVEPGFVSLLVPIISSVGVKRVPIVPEISGRPAAGYVVDGIEVDPQQVTLTGSSGALNTVQSISTFVIDVGQATSTFTRTVPLEEPPETRIASEESTVVQVRVFVRPLAQSVEVVLPISVQLVDVAPGLLYSINPQVVSVRLVGSAAAIAKLDTARLVAQISAAGAGPGQYLLRPILILPPAITIAEDLPTVALTLRLPDTPTLLPTPSEMPATRSPIPSAETPAPTETATQAGAATPAATTPADAIPTGRPPVSETPTPTATPTP